MLILYDFIENHRTGIKVKSEIREGGNGTGFTIWDL